MSIGTNSNGVRSCCVGFRRSGYLAPRIENASGLRPSSSMILALKEINASRMTFVVISLMRSGPISLSKSAMATNRSGSDTPRSTISLAVPMRLSLRPCPKPLPRIPAP